MRWYKCFMIKASEILRIFGSAWPRFLMMIIMILILFFRSVHRPRTLTPSPKKPFSHQHLSTKMTYRELFEKAKADGHQWADAAIDNCLNPDKETINTQNTDLRGSLFFAFSWKETKQGSEYWASIYKSLPPSNSNAIP